MHGRVCEGLTNPLAGGILNIEKGAAGRRLAPNIGLEVTATLGVRRLLLFLSLIHIFIGNNFVCIIDPDGREVILRGLGIGFKKQSGDLVPACKVEKIYDLRDPEKSSRLMELLGDVPAEFLDVSTEIIEEAKRMTGRRLSENIYITLTCLLYTSRCV